MTSFKAPNGRNQRRGIFDFEKQKNAAYFGEEPLRNFQVHHSKIKAEWDQNGYGHKEYGETNN